MTATASETSLRTAALRYACRGWRVLPCEPGGKRPLGSLVPHGLHDASCELDQVADWWVSEPEANIGLATGHDFDVLDVDGPDALDRLERAGPLGGDNVEGPTVATPRPGWHVYVAPTGRGNTTRLGGIEGLDWRGANGYAVAPPSVKADGTRWEWMTGTPEDLGPDTPIRPAPAWVLDLFERRPVAPAPSVVETSRGDNRTRAYRQRALDSACWSVASATPGTRNHALNCAAFSLGQLVAGGVLDVDEVTEHLLVAAQCARLPEVEARRTIASGLRGGMAQPRGLPA